MNNQKITEELAKAVVGYRRGLHRIPELDRDLPETRAYLMGVLGPLGCEIRDHGGAGFTAFFSCGTGGAVPARGTIAFRADMDALPIEEATNGKAAALGFRSAHDGKMHACGHDGHMAVLLGLARWIAQNRASLERDVLLIFQASEETTGGAREICESGALRDRGIRYVYGMHLWPGYEVGTVVCRANEFMAGTHVITAELAGRSAHLAEYENGLDALDAGCRFVLRVYAAADELPKDSYHMLRFGQFLAGTANNIVAGTGYITGAARTFSDDVFALLWEKMAEIAVGIETETGVRFSLAHSDGYPPVINPPALYEGAKRALTAAGFVWEELEAPLFQAEDFSFYQKEAPGLYLHLGAGAGAPLHTPDFSIDERALEAGLRVFQTLLA